MKVFLLSFLCIVSAQAQSCPQMFVSDSALLVSWGLEQSHKEKLIGEEQEKLVHQSAQAIRLIESAPRSFYRFMSVIVPYALLAHPGLAVELNPLLHDPEKSRLLWDQLGLSAVAAMMELTDPEWHAAFLRSPSLELMGLITTAASIFPLTKPIKDRQLDDQDVAILSIRRLLTQEPTDQYCGLILHSRTVRAAILEPLVDMIFRDFSKRNATQEEQDLMQAVVAWKVARMAPPPKLSTKLVLHSLTVCSAVKQISLSPDLESFQYSFISLLPKMANLAISSSSSAEIRKGGPLELVRLVREYTLKDADGSMGHLPLLFSSLMATVIWAEWPDPEQVRAALSEGLRLQIAELDQTSSIR